MVILTVDKKELYRSGRGAEVKKELRPDESASVYEADYNKVMMKILMGVHRMEAQNHHTAA